MICIGQNFGEQDSSSPRNDPEDWQLGLHEIHRTAQQRKLSPEWIGCKMVELFANFPLDRVAVILIVYKELQN